MKVKDRSSFKKQIERRARRLGYPRVVSRLVATDLSTRATRRNPRARFLEMEIHRIGSEFLGQLMSRSYDPVPTFEGAWGRSRSLTEVTKEVS